MNEATVPVPRTHTEIKLTPAQEVRFWSKVNKNGPTQPHMESPCWLWTAGKTKTGYGTISVNKQTLLVHRVAWALANGSIPHDGSFHGICVCHRCDRRDCTRVDHFFLGTQADNVADRDAKNRHNPPTGDRHGSRTKPECVARGDKHGARLHPERISRGDLHYTRVHPEKVPRGDNHHSRLRPERLARGDANGSRTKPECLPRGEANKMSKLTDAKVIDIRARHAAGGVTQKQLAAQFGVCFQLISLVVNRKIWRHI